MANGLQSNIIGQIGRTKSVFFELQLVLWPDWICSRLVNVAKFDFRTTVVRFGME